MNEDYKDFMHSLSWHDKRKEAIEYHMAVCNKCGKTKKLQVHHLNYDNEFGSEGMDDLMVLCDECHKEIHQSPELFDNPEKKGKCPECNRILIKIKENLVCNLCHLTIFPNLS